MQILALHNPDAAVRAGSSAGGIFTLLAESTIASGGVVYGAAFDPAWNIVHTRVADPAALAPLRGSKYAFSNHVSSITEAIDDLAAGRKVLFSGTPCQVAAMRKRAGNDTPLLLVEVVCHGAPRHEIWQRYLAELCHRLRRTPQQISSINFRDKSTGWKGYSFTIEFNDGTRFSQPHDDNPYMRAFLADLTLRQACFRCPFKYPDGTKADITIGDFWGISQLAPEIDNNLGTTIVIARTENGQKALSHITAHGDIRRQAATQPPLTLDAIARYNPAVTTPPTPNPRQQQFDADTETPASLIAAMKRHTARPLRLRLRLAIARIARKILNK